jgi:hypothetical protein
LKSEFKLAPIEALPGEIEGKSSAFGTSDGLCLPLVKTDDAGMVPILERRSGSGILLAMTKTFNPPRRPGVYGLRSVRSKDAWAGFGRVEFASNQGEPRAVAFDAGIDRSYVGGLERLEENPTVDLLDRLARSSRGFGAGTFTRRPNRPGTIAFSNAGKSGGGLYGRDQ